MITIFRIDDRLLHGQVALSWIKQYRIQQIVIVNDEVANDEFSKMTLCLAKTKDVELLFTEVKDCSKVLEACEDSTKRVMCIVSSFLDAKCVLPYLPQIHHVNLGGMRKRKNELGKVISGSVSLSNEDIQIIKEFAKQNIHVEIRQIPGEKEIWMDEVLKND